MDKNDFTIQTKEYTLKPGETEKKTMLFVLPLAILFGLPFFLIQGKDFFLDFKLIVIDQFFISFPVVLLGILLHEMLHGISWVICSKKGFRAIVFGLSKKNLTPYCHCRFPIQLKHYIRGGIIPALLLGLMPIVISWFIGNTGIFLFGMVFSLGAGSDILICWKLRKLPKDCMVQDFPDKTGCYLVSVNSNQ